MSGETPADGQPLHGRLRPGPDFQAFAAKARHCGRLATSWSCPSFASPSWPPPRVLTLGRRRQRCAANPRAPGRPAGTCLSGRPRRSRSGRVPALPARSQRKYPAVCVTGLHGVARRTSLPSAPEDTSSSPGHAAGQDVSGRAPRASDDGGRWIVGARDRQTGGMGAAGSPGHARGSGVARRPSSPKGRHNGHRREPCFCYVPAPARSAPPPTLGPVPGRPVPWRPQARGWEHPAPCPAWPARADSPVSRSRIVADRGRKSPCGTAWRSGK